MRWTEWRNDTYDTLVKAAGHLMDQETRIKLYWRFLETLDEYFPYSEKAFPPQGLWRIYGIGLPDSVLQKVYSGNAARIIPGVQSRLDALRP